MSDTAHSNLLRRVSTYANGNQSLALATVLQVIAPTAAHPGDKAVVSPEAIVDGWLGGGCVQPAVLKTAQLVIDDGTPRLIQVGPQGDWEDVETIADFRSGCLSGGTVVLFVEPLNRAPSLTILGDSAVAQSLGALAADIEFDVLAVADDHTQVRGDYVVVATQGKGDLSALGAAVESGAQHVFLVASPKKAGQLKQRLIDRGADAARVAAIEAPAGFDIGAATPGEIAVSILARIVQRLRQPDGVVTSESKPAVQPAVVDTGDGHCCGD